MNTLIQGDPMQPSSTDLIAQQRQLAVGEPVPEGWRVLSGGVSYSTIARVAYRYEAEAEQLVCTTSKLGHKRYFLGGKRITPSEAAYLRHRQGVLCVQREGRG